MRRKLCGWQIVDAFVRETSLTSMECVGRATVRLVGTGPMKSGVLCKLPYSGRKGEFENALDL